jgi:hypothetical protein
MIMVLQELPPSSLSIKTLQPFKLEVYLELVLELIPARLQDLLHYTLTHHQLEIILEL